MVLIALVGGIALAAIGGARRTPTITLIAVAVAVAALVVANVVATVHARRAARAPAAVLLHNE